MRKDFMPDNIDEFLKSLKEKDFPESFGILIDFLSGIDSEQLRKESRKMVNFNDYRNA